MAILHLGSRSNSKKLNGKTGAQSNEKKDKDRSSLTKWFRARLLKEKKRRGSIDQPNHPFGATRPKSQRSEQTGKSPVLSGSPPRDVTIRDVDFDEAVATFGQELFGLLREWIWVKQNVSIAIVGEKGVGKSFLTNSLLEATMQDLLHHSTTSPLPAAHVHSDSEDDLDSDFCLIPSDNDRASSSTTTVQRDTRNALPHEEALEIGEHYESVVNWSSEQEASKNIQQYCITSQFNTTVADRYSYVLPQGPFASIYSRTYRLTYSTVPELHTKFISETQLRQLLWKLHDMSATELNNGNNESVQYLKRQYRQVLNVPREHPVPIPGLYSLDQLPVPADIVALLGRSFCFKGKGEQSHLDRIFVREKLLEVVNQYGFILDDVHVAMPCGVLQGNRELSVLDSDCIDPLGVLKRNAVMSNANLVIVAMDRRGLTSDMCRLLKTTGVLDKLVNNTDEHKIVFIDLSEREEVESPLSGHQMFQFKNMDHVRQAVLSEVSNQLKQYLLETGDDITFDLPPDTDKIVQSFSVISAKPLLYSSLSLANSHNYHFYLEKHFGVSLAEAKKASNIPLLLATIQNMALSKSAAPLKEFNEKWMMKSTQNSHKKKRGNIVMHKLSSLISGPHHSGRASSPPSSSSPRHLISTEDHFIVTLQKQAYQWKEALVEYQRVLLAAMQQKAQECNQNIFTNEGAFVEFLDFVPMVWQQQALLRITQASVVEGMIQFAFQLLEGCSKEVKLPHGATMKEKTRLLQILKFCKVSAEKTIRAKIKLFEQYVAQTDLHRLVASASIEYHDASPLVNHKILPQIGEGVIRPIYTYFCECLSFCNKQLEAIEKHLEDSIRCLIYSPNLKASQVMNFLIGSQMQQRSVSYERLATEELLASNFEKPKNGFFGAHRAELQRKHDASQPVLFTQQLWLTALHNKDINPMRFKDQLSVASLTLVPPNDASDSTRDAATDLVVVVADSNSQFKALSFLVYGTMEGHPVVRLLVMNEILANPTQYAGMVQSRGLTLDEYVCSMSKDGGEGDEITMQAFADFNHCNLVLYSPLLPQPMLIKSVSPVDEKEEQDKHDTFCLAFTAEGHYAALVKPSLRTSSGSVPFTTNNVAEELNNLHIQEKPQTEQEEQQQRDVVMLHLSQQEQHHHHHCVQPLASPSQSDMDLTGGNALDNATEDVAVPSKQKRVHRSEEQLVVASDALERKAPSFIRGGVKSLQEMCIQVISTYAEYLPPLEGCIPEDLVQRILTKVIDEGRLEQDVLEKTLDGSMMGLSLQNCKRLTSASLALIASQCKSLRQLNLANCGVVTSEDIIGIARGCPHLEELNLEGCYLIDTAAIQTIAKHCQALTSVNLSHCCRVSDLGVQELTATCKHLRALNTSHCAQLTDAAFRFVPEALTCLDVSECTQLTEGGLQHIFQRCHHLVSVKLSGKNVTDASVAALAESCSSSLNILELEGCDSITDASVLDIASHCPELSTLALNSCKGITDAGFANCSNGIHFLRLRHLDLTRCLNVSSQSVSSIAQHCSNLEFLSLASCEDITEASLQLLVGRCKDLRCVNLSGCAQVNDSILQTLARNCPQLQHLIVFNCTKITDASLIAVATYTQGLQELNISSCENIGEEGLKVVAAHCRSLQTLILEECKVTDQAIAAIAHGCPDLCSLSLAYCKDVTNDALLLLAQKCPNMHTLDLSYSRLITMSGIKAVLPCWPSLKTLNLRGFSTSAEDFAIQHPNLQSLNLSWCKNVNDVAISKVVKGCPCLESLQLAWCSQITSNAIHTLARNATTLRVLNIRGCNRVSTIMIKFLSSSGMVIFH